MAELTDIIHNYLRHNKKFPHVFCGGCGHGIVLGALISSINALNIPKDKIALVAGIGCSGRIAAYVDFNTVHTTHGRALTYATGIKMANPDMEVICIMGDGDGTSIGGNHLIHAARRNIGVTALILNNYIYGMTGGQASPATPFGSVSQTTPFGQMEKPFDVCELVKAAGANGVYRGTVFHATKLDKMVQHAITRPGFNLVEILTPCHTQFGRKNKFKTPVEMYKWLKSNTTSIDRWNQLDEAGKAAKIPTGTFVEKDAPGIEERYQALCKQLKKPRGSAS